MNANEKMSRWVAVFLAHELEPVFGRFTLHGDEDDAVIRFAAGSYVVTPTEIVPLQGTEEFMQVVRAYSGYADFLSIYERAA